MTNNLRIEYLVRKCVPKVGRQNQGKEIVRGNLCQKDSMSTLHFTWQIPLMLYSISVTAFCSTPQGIPKSKCCSIHSPTPRFGGGVFFVCFCGFWGVFVCFFLVGWFLFYFMTTGMSARKQPQVGPGWGLLHHSPHSELRCSHGNVTSRSQLTFKKDKQKIPG